MSVAIHALLVVGLFHTLRPFVWKAPERIIVLQPLADSPRAVEMPYKVPRTIVGGPVPPRPPKQPRRLPDAPRTTAVLPEVPPTPAVELPRDTSSPPPPPRSVIGRIGPDLGDGTLWVRPLPLPPRELAQRLRRTHVELVDSAVNATIQAFLDSIALEPRSATAALPKWSTEVAGKKIGLDQKYIYLGGLKIPAAVLALLPISGGTNQQKAFDNTPDLLVDLRTAAQRSETVDEFKQAIRDLRERKQAEHEFEHNQRTPPPPELRSEPPAGPAAPAAAHPAPRDTTTT
ncbi:MAG TPA: hypothetical protein VFW66_15040 [Gemmatimonadales bacterium]|nr:hypothetical protein [Gemmatimonadales bacterium]